MKGSDLRRRSNSRLRLGIVVAGITTLLVTSAAIAVALVSESTVEAMSDEIIHARGQLVVSDLRLRLEERLRSKAIVAEILSADARVVDAVARRDQAALAAVVVPLKERLNVEQIDVYDSNGGRLLHLSPSESTQGATELLAQSESGQTAAQVQFVEDGLIVQASAPINDGSGVVGTILVSRSFSGAKLNEIAGRSDVRLALFSGHDPVYFPAEISAFSAMVAHSFGETAEEHEIIDGQFIPVAVSLDDEQTIVALVDLSWQLDARARTRRTLFVAVAIIAVAGALLVLELTRRLARSIGTIETAAREVSAGRYDTRLPGNPFIELDTLSTTINRLASEVQLRVSDLEGAQRGLRASLESKDRLIASVSHEIRTPLTAIVGYGQMLDDHGPQLSEQERAEMIRHIADESLDMSDIIDDLLVASRAESGHLTVTSNSIDVRPEIDRVVDLLRHNLSQKSCTVDASGTVTGDAGRIRQIIRNLLTNAIRYGGDAVRIEAADVGERIEIIVSDDGDPILLDRREAIFAPFERAHERSGVTASVGLGLTVSRQLAELMCGSLEYRRVAGRNEFVLSLPGERDGSDSDSGSPVVTTNRQS